MILDITGQNDVTDALASRDTHVKTLYHQEHGIDEIKAIDLKDSRNGMCTLETAQRVMDSYLSETYVKQVHNQTCHNESVFPGDSDEDLPGVKTIHYLYTDTAVKEINCDIRVGIQVSKDMEKTEAKIINFYIGNDIQGDKGMEETEVKESNSNINSGIQGEKDEEETEVKIINSDISSGIQWNKDKEETEVKEINSDMGSGIQGEMDEEESEVKEINSDIVSGIQEDKDTEETEAKIINSDMGSGIQGEKDEEESEAKEINSIQGERDEEETEVKEINSDIGSGIQGEKGKEETEVKEINSDIGSGIQGEKDEEETEVKEINSDISSGIQGNKGKEETEVKEINFDIDHGIQGDKDEEEMPKQPNVSFFKLHRALFESSIIMSPMMWCYLRQAGVVTQDEEELFRIGQTCLHQVAAVLDHLICRNKEWMFEAFITALVDTDQEHVLESLGVEWQPCDNRMNDPILPHDPTEDAGFPRTEHLWDRANVQCNRILQDYPIYYMAVKYHRVYLVTFIELRGLWPHLRQYDVVDADMEEELKTSPTQQRQLERLLDYLLKGPLWKVHGLLKSLAETGQDHIITGINIDPDIYTTKDYHLDEISKAHKTLSDHYLNCANSFNVMKFVYKAPRVALQRTYVKLLLLSSVNEVVAGSRLDDARIEESQIFETSSLNTLVEGDPGTGKTYLALHLAHAWIKRAKGYQFASIDLFIFIRPNDIRESLEATILAALKGSDREKRVMFAFWKWHPKKCCIVVDALDEISSHIAVVNELFNLMENKACFFIITCRTQHPVLDMRTNVFQRIIRVVGFDESDVVPFITKFLSEPDKATPEHVNKICEVVSKDRKLTGLCCNPLVACLICLLVAERKLTAQSLAGLTLLEIYQKIEELILLRENKRVTDDMGRDLHILHKLALRSLLFSKHSYSEKVLREFGITSDSSVLVFLQKDQSQALWAGFEESFHWLHRSFMEFAAAMALEGLPKDIKQLLICHICSRRDLNHVGHFLGYLFQDDPDQLALVCKATLALQQPVESKVSCMQCLNAAQNALSTGGLDINDILTSENPTLIQADHNVAKMLQPCSCFMQSDTIDVSKGLATIHQATRCLLSAKSEEIKSHLAKLSLHAFLPIQWKKSSAGNVHIHAVPGSPRIVITSEEYVCWPEVYYYLVHPKDLLTSGALDVEWSSSETMGPLNGLVLDFSDPEMNATFGFHNPSAQDLSEVITHIANHPKPVLSGMCSLLLMYPTQGNINPALEMLNTDLLRMLHRRGIRRFIIWDGHTNSEALVQWIDGIEKEFSVLPTENMIGNWMKISDDRLLSRATNLLFWSERVEMEFLFYGLDIFLTSPADSAKEHTKRLKQTGLLQHSHWIHRTDRKNESEE